MTSHPHAAAFGAPRPNLKPGEMTLGALNADGRLAIFGRSPDGNFFVTADYEADDEDRLVVTRLEVDAWNVNNLAPVTTDTLRDVPLGRWIAGAHSMRQTSAEALHRDDLPPILADHPAALANARRMAARVTKSHLRRGPKGFPANFYRRIALTYLDLQAAGVTRGIQQQIAEKEAERQDRLVDWVLVRDWLRRATELGFLTPGTRGRAGRGPGPNLYNGEDTHG